MVGHRCGGRFVTRLLIAGAVGLGLFVLVAFRPARGMNVILITVDTLRADHLGAYGYARNTSPNIDRFAKEATLFRYAFSHAPTTNPSLSSLMTSHYPHETKVLSNRYRLPPGAVTLAEILKANGYRTGAVVSNASLQRGSGFEQGFDTYDYHTKDQRVGRLTVGRIAPKTTLAANKWLEGNYQHKFFLWVHYMDPHGPYTPPSPYSSMFVERRAGRTTALPINKASDGKGGIPANQVLGSHRDPAYYIAQYDGEVRFFDRAFRDLMETIQRLGLFDTSLIIFTADHGEGMGEHDYYFGHSEFLYNGLVHVPLIVRLPGQSSAMREVRYHVAHVDLLPTVLETLSIASPMPLRGRTVFSGQAKEKIFAETGGWKYTLIMNGMKLIQEGSTYELYDIHKDFSEQVNVMMGKGDPRLRAKVADLKMQLDAARQQDALALGSPLLRPGDATTRKVLRALGYLQ